MRMLTWMLLTLALLLAGCSREPAVEQLLERADALETAIEDKQNNTAMAMLSEDFTTGNGQNRQDAQRLLLMYAMRHQKISVVRSQIEASLDSAYADQAQITFVAIVTGGEGWLPERGRSYRVDSRWTFIEGEWYLNTLRWEPLL